MNKALPAILVIITLAMGSFAVYEFREADHLREVIAQMKKDAAAAREESDDNTAELRKLKELTKTQKATITQLETLNQKIVTEQAEGAKSPEAKPADGADTGNGFMKGLAKMFNDPKMKEAMKGQQAMVIQMMYGDLAKALGLSPDEARQVLAILAERQTELSAQGMSLMSKGGPVDKAAMAEIGKQTEATKAAYDEQIKGILGDAKYKEFQGYEKSVGERVAIDQLQKQLSASGTPLDAKQSEGLLAIMSDERTKTPNSAGSNPAAQAKLMESDEAMNTWMQGQEDFNRRVLERARTVLSPDQILAFEAAQKQMINMQKMGMQMGREMLKGGKK